MLYKKLAFFIPQLPSPIPFPPSPETAHLHLCNPTRRLPSSKPYTIYKDTCSVDIQTVKVSPLMKSRRERVSNPLFGCKNGALPGQNHGVRSVKVFSHAEKTSEKLVREHIYIYTYISPEHLSLPFIFLLLEGWAGGQ